MRRRPATTAVSLTALVLAGLAVPITGTVARAAEPARTVTLVGSLQDELGCPGDWQPECTATDLTRVGETTTYTRDFTVPKGSYELKVAINHSWDESYGQGSGNVPLVLAGPATAALQLRRRRRTPSGSPRSTCRDRPPPPTPRWPRPRCVSSRRASASTS